MVVVIGGVPGGMANTVVALDSVMRRSISSSNHQRLVETGNAVVGPGVANGSGQAVTVHCYSGSGATARDSQPLLANQATGIKLLYYSLLGFCSNGKRDPISVDTMSVCPPLVYQSLNYCS